MTARNPTLDALIRDVEAKAEKEIDPLAVVSLLLKLAIRSEADPYLLIGQLVEGIAATVGQRIPPQRREDVAASTAYLLDERLRAYGAI
jgi:hypothetical protein